MADQKPRAAKRRKSGDSTATKRSTEPPHPVPPRYYSSPPSQQMGLSAQYPPQEMYDFPPPHQQYPYRASPSQIGSMPHGYPSVPQGQTFQDTAHPPQTMRHRNPPYITPDWRQTMSSIPAFGSPSSTLTRQLVASSRVGAAKTPSKSSLPGKFIHFHVFYLAWCCPFILFENDLLRGPSH